MSRPDPLYLRLALTSAVREAIWLATCRHTQGELANILLFATRRGGSTFAMEVIGANTGVRTLNQPFSTVSRAMTAGQVAAVPRFRQGQLTSVDASTATALTAMMGDVFAGRLVINAPTRFWRRDTKWSSDRLVLKITDAKPIIGWFDAHIDADIVYLTRHPIPQSLSCLRNGWNLTVDAHLRDTAFLSDHVPDDAVALAHDVMATGTPLQQFVLNWALENVAPLRLLGDRPAWTHIRYEDGIRDPATMIDRLADRLTLRDRQRMAAVVTRPSVSSKLSSDNTRRAIADGRAAAAVMAWRQQIEPADEAWCNRLLERFGIDPHVILPEG